MSKLYNPSMQFQTISDASRTTGLSQFYLRRGCRDNTVPHIRVGEKKYLVNVPRLLRQLDEQSAVHTAT